MIQEEKDKLLKQLNQIVELSNKAITIWTGLLERGEYPAEDCLKQIHINNKTKESCLKLIEEYEQQHG